MSEPFDCLTKIRGHLFWVSGIYPSTYHHEQSENVLHFYTLAMKEYMLHIDIVIKQTR